MLRNKFFVDALELFFNPFDLLSRRRALRVIQFQGLRTGQPSLGAVHDRGDHFQIVPQLGGETGGNFLLSLRLEEQPGVVQNA